MKRKTYTWVLVFAAIFALFAIRLFVNERAARTLPRVAREDIGALLAKEHFTQKDYQALLCQTGLGRSAVDDIKRGSKDFLETMLTFQEQYFEESNYLCEFLFPTTKEESLISDSGRYKRIELAPVRDGDILITRATHTLGWRHGHAAIVTDAKREETVESVVLGQKSSLQELDKWRNYPTLLILRPKDDEVAKKAAAYAKKALVGVDYGLFVGMVTKDKQFMQKIDTTQCAHLVWQAYRAAGLDIDGNGWLVLPKDLAACHELEVVQAYGFDPLGRN